MKIAYLSYESPNDNSGIAKKISAQVQQWRNSSHDVGHFLLREPPSTVEQQFFSCRNRLPVPTLNSAIFSKQLLYSLELFSPDLIYLREIIWFPGLLRALKVAPYVVEVNSDLRSEYEKNALIKVIFYSMTHRQVFARAAGCVFVTDELAAKLKDRICSTGLVLGNGYDFENCPTSAIPQNTQTNFIFVSSSNQNWHGLDELEALAGVMPGSVFHVVVPGYESNLSNVRAYGGLYGGELDRLYSQVDLAIGPLALHRKGLHEASPLKVREYLAHGIPVILPFLDTDLAAVTPEQGVLKIADRIGSAAEAVKQITDFADMWKGRRVSTEFMASFLSCREKEKTRLEYFRQVLGHAL